MAINGSVQHNGGFLPGIIVLIQCYVAAGKCNGHHLGWSVASLGFP